VLRDTSWESIAEHLATARRVRPQLTPLVDALEPVLALVHREAQAAALPQIPLAEPEVRNGIGLPVLSRAEFPVDVGEGVRVFRQLVAAAPAFPPREQAGDPKWIEGVLLAYASGDLEAAPSEGEAAGRVQQLTFFAGLALLPALEAAATCLGRWVSPAWAEAICPVCGTQPRLAELRAPEGRRYLHCGFCGWVWAYRRSGCPFCDNADGRGIERLEIEGDPRCKIELCQQCRRYLKLVDNNECFGLVPSLEDLTTPHLDLLATGRGYR
jgi:FdhE protein